VGLDVTYFTGSTKDAILSRLGAAVEWVPRVQLFNAGQVIATASSGSCAAHRCAETTCRSTSR
jgi:hypothetical protein